MITTDLICECGGDLIIDYLIDDGAFGEEAVSPYVLPPNGYVTRCYCNSCGLMYHPSRAGTHRYTTPTRVNPR